MTDTSDITSQPAAPLSDWEMKAFARAKLEAELFTLNKATLLNALTLAGVTRVVVSFDGYGDSGQIENVEAQTGHDPVTMPSAAIEIAEAVWDQAEPKRSSVSIAEAVESLAYDVLGRTHCGWENNDGAYGDVIFDTEEETITLDYNERYTASENYTHTF
ncbi:hypothetical protein RHAL1_04099 [Beijerinckiaceae bacterium RH AL1]|jgi:hypothetical protein|nr:hypothetical protein RHCH11_RHCH11_04024 [Beijerinckiaceae bacterium RH CH11]VVB50033.1 hypothetical protein RHAL8_04020 [Beijerinckiaceae bacterium RH AL8]VVC57161.1 hypothetical protein RHAL1_04099 [Beijerinckiaceae bacterium RH AL1]